jgi:hypothetical protein
MGAQVCSLLDQNQEFYQISCHSIPILSDGSSSKK